MSGTCDGHGDGVGSGGVVVVVVGPEVLVVVVSIITDCLIVSGRI